MSHLYWSFATTNSLADFMLPHSLKRIEMNLFVSHMEKSIPSPRMFKPIDCSVYGPYYYIVLYYEQYHSWLGWMGRVVKIKSHLCNCLNKNYSLQCCQGLFRHERDSQAVWDIPQETGKNCPRKYHRKCWWKILHFVKFLISSKKFML